MSNTRLVVLPLRLVTFWRAAREPSDTKLEADVQSFPGRRIIWLVAPAWRIAVTQA
jgi:hypothetical protein